MADEGIKLEGPLAGLLGNNLPTNGGVPDDKTPPAGGEDAAAKAAEATRVAAEAAKAEAGKGAGGSENQDQLTDDQIQTKLDELAEKDKDQLSDEDKKFIEKHTGESLNDDEVTLAKKALEAKYNIKIEGTFDNSPEGLVNLTETAAKVRAEQKIVDLLQDVPHMLDFYNHVVVEKRSLETFLDKNIQPVFKAIKIEEIADTNDKAKNDAIIANQKHIFTMEMKQRGMNDDDIESLIQIHEDKGTLFAKAKESYTALETRHKQGLDAKLKAEEQRIQTQQKAIQETLKKVNTIIDSNNFGGTAIPAEDLKAFKDAALKPVDDDGNTILDYKRAKLTLEQRLLIDYIIHKDFKGVGLAATKASSNKKFEFKKRSEDNNERGGGRLRGSGENELNQSMKLPFDMTKFKVEHQQ